MKPTWSGEGKTLSDGDGPLIMEGGLVLGSPACQSYIHAYMCASVSDNLGQLHTV